MSRRILIILGQPSSNSLCAALARTYADAARQSGAEVRLLELGKMTFDPVLHHGYAQIQPLEPDLLDAQASITWAQHLVWVYPIWWGGAAWPVNGFVKANDFTGKTVIPFCTSASSALGQSGETLAQLAGTGDWQEGQRFGSSAARSDVADWLTGLGFTVR